MYLTEIYWSFFILNFSAMVGFTFMVYHKHKVATEPSAYAKAEVTTKISQFFASIQNQSILKNIFLKWLWGRERISRISLLSRSLRRVVHSLVFHSMVLLSISDYKRSFLDTAFILLFSITRPSRIRNSKKLCWICTFSKHFDIKLFGCLASRFLQ